MPGERARAARQVEGLAYTGNGDVARYVIEPSAPIFSSDR